VQCVSWCLTGILTYCVWDTEQLNRQPSNVARPQRCCPSSMTARLYVGGLPPDISAADVIGRFTTFGSVSSCELVPSKGLQGAPGTCRGFAYVDLQPKDDHSVARCLSLVCKLLRMTSWYCTVQPGLLQGP
jgi:hypothetical protein